MTTKETPEPQPVDNWEFFTDGAYWDMCAVRPVGDRDFNSPNLFHVLNLKEGERLASLLNSHCAYSAQPTPPPIDVKALANLLDKWDNQGEINHEELCLFIEAARAYLKASEV